MKKLIPIFCILFSVTAFAQDQLTVKETVLNPSDQINDGAIDLQVEGGTPPYTYKWSNQSTPLTSKKAIGLTEGVEYSVTVTDSQGVSATSEYQVETQSITEVFNGAMTPAVAALGSVLFWDPFDAIGIYDPVAYADVKLVATPGWSANVEEKFVLKE
ncbi:MAG TPA: SprB repeat-containing protein, partial [Pricia sp.]|nr:SprB repeat-containing protein [Pricia sp.]